jgi:phosphoserine phosphatase
MPIYALVLTTPPQRPSLSDFAVERAYSVIPEALRRSQRWLAPNEAWEGEFVTNEVGASAELRADVMFALKGLTLDVNIVTAEPQLRRNRLLVADMESTIIEQECLDELAEYAGLRERISEITARAMRGELDFEAAIKERVGLLAGMDAARLQEVYDGRVTLMPGAATLIATLKANGARCALVSGGFDFFAERIAQRLGFDEFQANRLEITGGKLTGRVVEPILGREAKLAALERLSGAMGLQRALTMATGDGANDLAMIKAAGLGVAFRAKPVVAAEADASITHGDLTALLYLQGYAKDEFVVP